MPTIGGYELHSIPVKIPDNFSEIIVLVDTILEAKKTDMNADISYEESKIDRLIYKLYGLTNDEIKIIEEM